MQWVQTWGFEQILQRKGGVCVCNFPVLRGVNFNFPLNNNSIQMV